MNSAATQGNANTPKQDDPLFQPLRLGHLTLKNRIMSTSHASGMDDESLPKERYQRYHEEKAKGGLALTMFGGSSNVAPDSPSVFCQLSMDDDVVIPYLQQFSERIHAHGAALMCQITHLGRRGDAMEGYWLPTIAPSPVRETLHRNMPREMDHHDIDRVVKSYGAAARRCKEGGLDGLETLAASHLIGQFFSPETNLRRDQFGGSVENRARFAMMVHEEIRRQVGSDFVVGMRLSIEEEGGLPFADALEIAGLLKREGLVDFFNCNVGRMDTEIALAEDNMPGMTRPLAPFLDQVGRFRAEVGLPVFHAARIIDVATARHAIRNGLLDMVAMTRAHIADPQIANKILRGEEDRIRPCIGASHCIYKKIHCIHNPASGRETMLPMEVPPAQTPGKKVVVVGGGPAGLEAARVAAERGHRVVLFEATPHLGGQVQLAVKANWRRDLIAIVDWREAELGHLGVDIRTNIYAEAGDVLAESPEHVFIATGGLPLEQNFAGAELAVSSWDILSGEVRPGKDVLICDGSGRHAAVSCADHLSALGHRVIFATIDDRAATEMGYTERVVFRKRLYQQGVETLPDMRISTLRRDGDRLVAMLTNELTGKTQEIEADQVMVEAGTEPLAEVFDELQEQSSNKGITDVDAMAAWAAQPEPEKDGFTLYRIGDAVTSRSIHAAILEAYRIAVWL
jgi:2,4-dienoyl-CoA reductase-like NADH-dependent reductase (Old Yellow Enzyme family)/thioredoxin reductase